MSLFIKIKLQALVIFMASACILNAQSYTNSPGDSMTQTTTLGAHAVVMNITQVHPTSDTLHFHWKKLSVSMPAGWAASICDNGLCFTSLVDSGMMIPIVPGDDGLMSIHCQADSNPGIGIIRYTLYEEKTSSKVDTLTWIVNANPNGIESVNNGNLKIHCASGNLSLSEIDNRFSHLEIYDVSGRLLMQDDIHQNENRYNVTLPNKVVYILRLSGTYGDYSQKIINQ